MTLARDFFKVHAHEKYLDGLRETGISVDRIPKVSEMDEKLQQFGWRAVGVSGFIPPAAFLEFQSRSILPIACEIRKVENIAYTPVPDIVHEAAGHAPIIADPDYSDYLNSYGQIAEKAIVSKKDIDLYNAIRHLSDIKEKPTSTDEEIDSAQKAFEKAYADLDYVSEATDLARMSWWTIEYGLVGDLNDFKIYGAGLLSSLGESFDCLKDHVNKVPFTVDCVKQAYDITRPQPQLFVGRDFPSMKRVLQEYSEQMAFKQGGITGLAKAKLASTMTTTVFENGLQISGQVKNFSYDEFGKITFIQFTGPMQFSNNDQELVDWTSKNLPKEFITPLGPWKSFQNESELTDKVDQEITFEYSSGLKAKGKLKSYQAIEGRVLFVELINCQFSLPGQEHVTQDTSYIVNASQVTSVYGGAADRVAFQKFTGESDYVSNPHIGNLAEEQKESNALYQKLRDLRDDDHTDREIWLQFFNESQVETSHWLLKWELLEALQQLPDTDKEQNLLKAQIKEIQEKNPDKSRLIQRGLDYLDKIVSK